jgi:hypothetical protein
MWASCTDGTDHRIDGTHRAGIIWPPIHAQRRPCPLIVLRCVTSLRVSLATALSVWLLSFRGGDIRMTAASAAALPPGALLYFAAMRRRAET